MRQEVMSASVVRVECNGRVELVLARAEIPIDVQLDVPHRAVGLCQGIVDFQRLARSGYALLVGSFGVAVSEVAKQIVCVSDSGVCPGVFGIVSFCTTTTLDYLFKSASSPFVPERSAGEIKMVILCV